MNDLRRTILNDPVNESAKKQRMAGADSKPNGPAHENNDGGKMQSRSMASKCRRGDVSHNTNLQERSRGGSKKEETASRRLPDSMRKSKERFLIEYRLCGKRIDRLCMEMEQWRFRSMRILSGKGLPGFGPCQDEITKIMLGIEKELFQEIAILKERREQVRRVINAVDEDILRILLEYRYINGYTIERTAEEMHYSTMQISRLLNKALQCINIDRRLVTQLEKEIIMEEKQKGKRIAS